MELTTNSHPGRETLTVVQMRFIRDIEEITSLLTLALVGGMVLSRDLVDIKSVEAETATAISRARVATKTFPDQATVDRFWREILLTRLVDRFTIFVAEILAFILRTRPELMSDQKVPLADVVAAPSLQAVVETVAAERADQLSYGGFREMHRYLQQSIGLQLPIPADVLAQARSAIAARNAIVHNRGLVSARYLAETGRTDLQIGQPVPLHEMGLASLTQIAQIVTRDTAAKFAPSG